MSRLRVFSFVAALGLALLGCGSPKLALDNSAIDVEPVYGSTLKGTAWSIDGDQLEIRLAALTRSGTFLRITAPAGLALKREIWQGDLAVLHLAVSTRGGVELGAVALAGYTGTPVTVRLTLGPEPRAVSVPPIGNANLVDDLTVEEIDTSNVRLSWTEQNAGDYDQNSEVNMADLVPLGYWFNTTVDNSNPASRNLPEYWVDGDHNGEVNLSDLTVIGQHYRSVASGYNIKRNGEILPGADSNLPTVKRSDYYRDRLPAFYSIQLPGTGDDTWEVVSVDTDLEEGTGSQDVVVNRLDLRVNADVEGIELLGGASPGTGPIVLRVIDPGDIVNRFPLAPPITGSTGAVFFDDLPRDRQLLLDIEFTPKYLLETGGENTSARAYIASVPFILADGGQQLDIDAQVDIASLMTGYAVRPTITQTYTTSTETSAWDLNAPESLVSSDTNGNANLADEAQLLDSDLDGVSDARLQYQTDYNTYKVDDQGEIQNVVILGKIALFDEAHGKILFDTSNEADPPRDITNLTPEQPQGVPINDFGRPLWVYFTELTTFIDASGEIAVPFDPSTIAPGYKLRMSGVRLTSPNLQGEIFWVSEVRVVPADYQGP